MAKQRVLITVKTYPSLSTKYGETVCTAGIREDGSWVRIYPVPFRRLEDYQQYAKYDWIECELTRNDKDIRPETYRPNFNLDITKCGHIGTSRDWEERRQIVLKRARVYDSMDALVAEAKANTASLAVFKPTKILNFSYRAEDREWDVRKLAEMRGFYSQLDLFEDNSWRETFSVVNKLPYGFYYKFEDIEGRQSEMKVLDWEIGALYWKCLRSTNGDELLAVAKVRQQYFENFITKDLHFYLGTTQEHHLKAPNPWTIVGVLPIPYEIQDRLF